MSGGVEPETPATGCQRYPNGPQAAAPPAHVHPTLLQQRRHRRRLHRLGPGFGDTEFDLTHRHPSRLPAHLPVWELRQYRAKVVHGGRTCLHRRTPGIPAPGAFYGVFDGHGGTDAVRFVRKNMLKFIIEDGHFPNSMEEAIKSAFVKADHEIADSHSLDRNSGTTALTVLIFGRLLLFPCSAATISFKAEDRDKSSEQAANDEAACGDCWPVKSLSSIAHCRCLV